MTDWMARARAEIPCMGQGRNVITDETPLSSVLAVPVQGALASHDTLSSVSSVGVGGVFENQCIADALMDAAMKVCDRHGDSEAARQEMRQDCLALAPLLQADLLAHFNGNKSPPTEPGAPCPDPTALHGPLTDY